MLREIYQDSHRDLPECPECHQQYLAILPYQKTCTACMAPGELLSGIHFWSGVEMVDHKKELAN